MKMKGSRVFKMMNEIILAYRERRDIHLVCWCVPERCHCEEIAKYIIENG